MYLLLTKTQGNRYIKKVPSETRLSENQVSLQGKLSETAKQIRTSKEK